MSKDAVKGVVAVPNDDAIKLSKEQQPSDDVKVSLGKELLKDAPSYEDNANIISFIMMSYLNPLLKYGAKNDLQIEGKTLLLINISNYQFILII